MEYIIAMGMSLLFSTLIAVVWVEKLSEYYESEQYEQDLKDGLYEYDYLYDRSEFEYER